jgi:cell division septation protein DedD
MSDALLTRIAEALEGLLAHAKADLKKIEAEVKPAKGKAKAATEPAASAPAAPAAATAVPAAVEPTPAPAPSVTLQDVNKLVLKVAAKNREGALAILGKFGLASTVGLAQEKWQAVYDAFEEEIAKIDAAAVKISEASLV